MLVCCKTERCACIQSHSPGSFVLFSFVSLHSLWIVLFSLFSPPSGPSLSSSGRTCPWPLPPSENSEARLLSPTHSFSALLEVRCKPGFTLPSGLDATIRRCQGDRQWSGNEPICTGRFEVTGKKIFFFLSGFLIVTSRCGQEFMCRLAVTKENARLFVGLRETESWREESRNETPLWFMSA